MFVQARTTTTESVEVLQCQLVSAGVSAPHDPKIGTQSRAPIGSQRGVVDRSSAYKVPVSAFDTSDDAAIPVRPILAHWGSFLNDKKRGKSLVIAASVACIPLPVGVHSRIFAALHTCPEGFYTMATPQLKTLSAHVTGFDYTSFHAYTTRVELSGASWTLALRYSQFLSFYEKLRSKEKKFKFDFPPKGGFFFTPKPEDRQVRLDAFLQAVIAFYNSGTKKQADTVAQLLGKFLQVEKNLKKALKSDEQTASDESASEEPVVEPKTKEVKVKKPKEAVKVSKKAEDGKKAFVNAAFEAAVVSAIQDNVKEAKQAKKEEVKVEGKKEAEAEKPVVEVKAKETKVEETKVEEVKKVAPTKEEKVEEPKVEDDKVEEAKVEEPKAEEVKVVEAKVEEAKVVETKIVEAKIEETKTKETKVDEVKVDEPVTMATSTSTATSRVTETTVESQPSVNKTVVGKTMTIVSKSTQTHSFKVEVTEQKPSVVTLTPETKELEKTDAEKTKKKKRSNKKKAKSRSRASTGSADGSDSPAGVDDDRVAKPRLSEAQKKNRNQRRKEKRKKNSKKISGKDLKA